jgi:hypothetical protein
MPWTGAARLPQRTSLAGYSVGCRTDDSVEATPVGLGRAGVVEVA